MNGTPGPPDLTRVELTRYGLEVAQLDGTRHVAVFNFPLPMEERTCVDGSHGRVVPEVTVTDGAGLVTHWVTGGRARLPAVVNDAVAKHFQAVVESTYRDAAHLNLRPVPESVVARYRATDPEATVKEIRQAEYAYQGMVTDLGRGSRATALWIARNFIAAETHRERVAALERRVLELVDLKPAECSCPASTTDPAAKPAADPGTEALLEAVQLLRTHGRDVLEFRAGRDDVEKILDLLDAA